MAVFYPRCHAHLNVVFDGRGGPDTPPLLVDTVPQSAFVGRNGYHDADTFSLEFDARLLPFDPDLIRQMAVAIYMFAAEGEDDRREWAVPEHEMILGLVDVPTLNLSKDGQRFSVEGRDYTALLLDQEWDPRNRIPSGRPLDTVVKEIADEAAPAGARLRFNVLFDSNEVFTPPIVGASRRGTKKKGLWVEPGKTVWDVIYELCLAEGFVVYVRGEDIIISDPRTQTRKSLGDAPRLIYGRELQSLEVSRRMGKERVPQIEVVSCDNKTGRTLRAKYPEKHETPKTGVGVKKDETERMVVDGSIRDLDALKRIARTEWEHRARAEAAYKYSTIALTTMDDRQHDLLRLDAGSPLYLQFDPFNSEQMRALNGAQRIEHLLALGYSSRLSAFVADYYERLDQFRQPYYQRTADFSYQSGALTISGETVNYAYAPRELQESLV